MVLTHVGFPSAEARDQHEDGWVGCVDRMAADLA